MRFLLKANNKDIHEKKKFYILFFFTILSTFFTYPLLKYPFDVFFHLEKIEQLYNTQALPAQGRTFFWHYLWSQLFYFFNIDNTQIFLRAKIIHISQIIISFLSLFYLSKVLIRNVFIKIEPIYINYLAYWATLIWFMMFSTVSEGQHHVWILWYSVNYQITLPLMLVITGLSITLIFESLSIKKISLHMILICIGLLFILKIHAAEFLYYLLYISVILIVFLDKIILFYKQHTYYALLSSGAMIVSLMILIPIVKKIPHQEPLILKYLSFDQFPMLLQKIQTEGGMVLSHFNKASTTMNALIYLSIIFMLFILFVFLYRVYKQKEEHLNKKMFFFLLLTSLFIFIPIIQFTAGLASVLTYQRLVYRFYFSSMLFMVIPIFVFYFLSLIHKKKLIIVNLFIVSILCATFIYSKYTTYDNHNYYKNVISIKNSFSKEKISFNLSQDEIELVRKRLRHYESMNKSEKEEYYYARDDIAVVVKFIYRKDALYSRRGNMDYNKSYDKHNNEKYYPILFETPKNFPAYQRFK